MYNLVYKIKKMKNFLYGEGVSFRERDLWKRDCGCASLRALLGWLAALRARCKLRLPQAHNLPLCTSCMRQIMPHPLRGCRVPSRVIKKESHLIGGFSFFRAGKGTRTLDPDLGKVVLYQLSYSRGVTQL